MNIPPPPPVQTLSLLSAIVESAPTALLLSDRDGRIVLANKEAERLFGYSHAELVALELDQLMPERFRALHPELRKGYLGQPAARRMGAGFNLKGLRKDGSEVPIEIGLNPVQTGNELFILSAIVDITERVQVEQRFRLAIESAPIAMLMVGSEGRIDLANAEAARLFGYAPDELLGQVIEVLLPPSSRGVHPAMRKGYAHAPLPRRMSAGRTLHGLRKDGSTVPVEIGLSPLETPSGPLVLAAVVDISERVRVADAQRRLNEELERRVAERTAALASSNEALERSNEELQQFAYIASHDLQTPLRGIAGCAQLLEAAIGKDADPEVEQLLHRMVSSTINLQLMIRDLLAFSRIDAREIRFQQVSMEEVMAEACSLLEAAVAESAASIRHDPLPQVMGDRTQLVQVMANLIGNAVKYHGTATPVIRVTAQDEEVGQVRISITDNGIGIAPEHLDRIFEIFKRLHTQQAYPGTGIGLAVCRRVVNRHGGRIWVESHPGLGSTFHFTLNKASQQ